MNYIFFTKISLHFYQILWLKYQDNPAIIA